MTLMANVVLSVVGAQQQARYIAKIFCLLALSLFAMSCESGLDETSTPTLSIEPSMLVFPAPDGANGDAITRTVELRNSGTGDLIIASVELEEEGDAADELFLNDADDWTQGTRTITPGESLTLGISWRPVNAQQDRGRVRVVHNAGNDAVIEISTPDLDPIMTVEVEPAELQTGDEVDGTLQVALRAATVGQPQKATVRIGNLSVAPLRIESLCLLGSDGLCQSVAASNGPFRLCAGSVEGPDLCDAPDLADAIGRDESRAFSVFFSPLNDSRDQYAATLAIRSNDAAYPAFEVSIVAQTCFRANDGDVCAGCGDGVIAQGEECDDGNVNSGDACLNDCRLNECGDGIVHQGVEECDDGNADQTDRCLNTCMVARCGDGIQGQWEECDDGNTADNDACISSPASGEAGDGRCVVARCGDSIVANGLDAADPAYESCDDGNQNNEDECLNTCTVARCGDGVIHRSVEACDDGNDSDTDACLRTCTLARCGDGLVHAGVEACDDGNTDNTDECTNSCELSRCGDGVTQAGLEDCDDGNTDDGDACTNQCRVARCGDGIVQSGIEICDDGNRDDTDGCTNQCEVAACGDGVVQFGVEDCDESDETRCRADCRFQPCYLTRQAMVSGQINQDLVLSAACGPYSLAPEGTVLSAGFTLTIEPGVTVRTSGENAKTRLLVHGHLHAVGTVERKIVFGTPTEQGSGVWEGIVLQPGGSADLAHVEMSGARRGLQVEPAAVVNRIENVLFSDGQFGLIWRSSSPLLAQDLRFERMQLAAIHGVAANLTARLTRVSVTGVGVGLWGSGDDGAAGPDGLWGSGDDGYENPATLWGSGDDGVAGPRGLWGSGDDGFEDPQGLWGSGDDGFEDPQSLWGSGDDGFSPFAIGLGHPNVVARSIELEDVNIEDIAGHGMVGFAETIGVSRLKTLRLAPPPVHGFGVYLGGTAEQEASVTISGLEIRESGTHATIQNGGPGGLRLQHIAQLTLTGESSTAAVSEAGRDPTELWAYIDGGLHIENLRGPADLSAFRIPRSTTAGVCINVNPAGLVLNGQIIANQDDIDPRGIRVGGNAMPVPIEILDAQIGDSNRGFKLEGGGVTSLEMANVGLWGSGDDGFVIADSAVSLRNVQISNSGARGLALTNGHLVANAVALWGSGDDGMVVDGLAEVTASRIYENAGRGLSVRGAIYLESTQVYGNGGAGLEVEHRDGGSVQVLSNTFDHNALNGDDNQAGIVYARTGNHDEDARLALNSLSCNGGAGLLAQAATLNLVHNNIWSHAEDCLLGETPATVPETIQGDDSTYHDPGYTRAAVTVDAQDGTPRFDVNYKPSNDSHLLCLAPCLTAEADVEGGRNGCAEQDPEHPNRGVVIGALSVTSGDLCRETAGCIARNYPRGVSMCAARLPTCWMDAYGDEWGEYYTCFLSCIDSDPNPAAWLACLERDCADELEACGMGGDQSFEDVLASSESDTANMVGGNDGGEEDHIGGALSDDAPEFDGTGGSEADSTANGPLDNTTWSDTGLRYEDHQIQAQVANLSAQWVEQSLATDGFVLAVGLPRSQTAFGPTGEVLVYESDSFGTWVQEGTLFRPETGVGQGDGFGTSLATDADFIMVGASGVSEVYVFEDSGDAGIPNWSFTQQLSAPGDVNWRFGESIAMDFDHAIIGSPGSNLAHIFTLGGEWVWRLTDTLELLDGEDEAFGTSVALSERFLVVGAPAHGALANGSPTGAAYVWAFDENNDVSMSSRAQVPGVEENAGFGSSVAVSHVFPPGPCVGNCDGIDLLFVGAPDARDGGTSRGLVYVFKETSGTWIPFTTLRPEVPVDHAHFGQTLSSHNHRVVVGAPGDGSANANAGGAYIFEWQGGTSWTGRRLAPSDGSNAESFGTSVTFREDLAAVGAPLAPLSERQSGGQVYVYELDDTPAERCPNGDCIIDEPGMEPLFLGFEAYINYDTDGTPVAEIYPRFDEPVMVYPLDEPSSQPFMVVSSNGQSRQARYPFARDPGPPLFWMGASDLQTDLSRLRVSGLYQMEFRTLDGIPINMDLQFQSPMDVTILNGGFNAMSQRPSYAYENICRDLSRCALQQYSPDDLPNIFDQSEKEQWLAVVATDSAGRCTDDWSRPPNFISVEMDAPHLLGLVDCLGECHFQDGFDPLVCAHYQCTFHISKCVEDLQRSNE